MFFPAGFCAGRQRRARLYKGSLVFNRSAVLVLQEAEADCLGRFPENGFVYVCGLVSVSSSVRGGCSSPPWVC